MLSIFVLQMESKLNVVPEKLDRLDKTIDENKTDYQKWLQLKPILDVVGDLPIF